ncbi:CPBP family intramembrane glutamic endopeptidase [Actinoplanes sp. GCM10030250]|uniref:CPBP family intramembrane glutamic endopeptidase n=1 Tax=Actinoplanes sp. GCM10030250 TaxID=3273376 RepID=UPI00360E841B
MAIVVTLLVMAAFRAWTLTGPRRTQPIVGPLAAAILVALSGLTPAEVGLVLTGWGYGVSCALLIGFGYTVALLIPAARRALSAGSYPRPVCSALVGVPLATVTFEEVAFRGVLWALIASDHGPVWATAVTAVIFGLWHLAPDPGSLPVVAFTTLAGGVLGVLRQLSGGLIAPFLVHWTANGLGILVSAAVSRSGRDEPGEPADPR